ncbi:type VI secretion system-associated protein TagF [Pseudocolwellia sp. HL-MZ19]|uniref:type VI secretion system-associated protein TagF n=1 Tax=Pseudocolwellia sp. HL-MZ19 TaxID=3400846 RepID=UPI003CEB1107
MSREPIKILGFCGKIPSKGDFVQSDFNKDFLKHWNEWLQAVIAVSKEQLGQDWLGCYLTSPIWHFSLSPEVCCESSVMGTLIPSVDLVGRHFPFTIAVEHTNTAVAAWHENEWAEKAEPAVLEVLEDDFDLIDWFENLDLNIPNVSIKTTSFSHHESDDKVKKAWVIQGNMSPEILDLLHLQYSQKFGAYSIWWTLGSELVEPCFIVTEGLPQVSQFVAMLNGQWQTYSWNTSEIIKG